MLMNSFWLMSESVRPGGDELDDLDFAVAKLVSGPTRSGACAG
jgi:hypothetical protein